MGPGEWVIEQVDLPVDSAAQASGGAYATDSQFTRAVEGLADRSDHRLFLSAPPRRHPLGGRLIQRSIVPVAWAFRMFQELLQSLLAGLIGPRHAGEILS
jgi:hypothetical protein